jgi:hypothetical protein
MDSMLVKVQSQRLYPGAVRRRNLIRKEETRHVQTHQNPYSNRHV